MKILKLAVLLAAGLLFYSRLFFRHLDQNFYYFLNNTKLLHNSHSIRIKDKASQVIRSAVCNHSRVYVTTLEITVYNNEEQLMG